MKYHDFESRYHDARSVLQKALRDAGCTRVDSDVSRGNTFVGGGRSYAIYSCSGVIAGAKASIDKVATIEVEKREGDDECHLKPDTLKVREPTPA